MFVGHFAAGFGAKAAAPRVSLGTLFLAAQWLLVALGWWVDRHRVSAARPAPAFRESR
ncbi:MAG: hypothetical protein H6Q10_2348 [Acidobacteria bacterium]|nr:hypothetical protein [Acidobacteriota bacterium]